MSPRFFPSRPRSMHLQTPSIRYMSRGCSPVHELYSRTAAVGLPSAEGGVGAGRGGRGDGLGPGPDSLSPAVPLPSADVSVAAGLTGRGDGLGPVPREYLLGTRALRAVVG